MEVEVFETHKKFFTLISIYPPPSGTKAWQKLFFAGFTICAVVLLFFCLLGHFLYIIKYSSIDLQLMLTALFAFMGIFPAFYSLIVFYGLRHSVRRIIDQFQKICKNRAGLKVFAPINAKNEYLANFMIKYIFPGMTPSFIPMCVISYAYHAYTSGTDNVDVSKLYVPLRLM